MTEFKLIYSGFDKLDFAFQGALPPETIDALKAVKDRAQKENEPQLVNIGPRNLAAHVFDRGMRGGYALRINTGPLGANFFIKESLNPNEWNFFVASQSTGLLAYGYREYWRRIVETLEAMDAIVGRESLNRVDFAMDFRTEGFELNLDQFVAPPKSAVKPRYSEWQGPRSEDLTPTLVTAGRRIQSATVGMMPGRQVIVYDKRAEAIQKHNIHWFEVWGIDPKDKGAQIYRVELRAGKKHLKQDYGLSRLSDLEDSICDVLKRMARDIRYISAGQSDTNVSRASQHPLWLAVHAALDGALKDHESGLQPGRILEIEREKQTAVYMQNIYGNAVGMAALGNMTAEHAAGRLSGLVAGGLKSQIERDPRGFARKLEKAAQKLRFCVAS